MGLIKMGILEDELIKQLDKIDDILDKQVEKYKQYLEKEDNNWIEFNLQNLNVNNFKADKNKGGIYYLQIKFNGQLDDLTSKSKIFDKLIKEWKYDERMNIPNIIKGRQSNHDRNDLKSKWVPFYLGKSNKFGDRMEEHFNRPGDCKTYGLKLNCIKNNFFSACSYRIKFMELHHLVDDKYYWSVVNIESKLRGKLHPICGKQ